MEGVWTPQKQQEEDVTHQLVHALGWCREKSDWFDEFHKCKNYMNKGYGCMISVCRTCDYWGEDSLSGVINAI